MYVFNIIVGKENWKIVMHKMLVYANGGFDLKSI